ncbi:6-phosphogluconolactonase [Fundidesulfovibrio terrae]|uniref:6-phosphogluconolactonase n=1 Tax=Fundidesulfovibrio terrae TaxID=2922866 RepID=UPI001FB02C90|nr:6-phosphogluconolactonase [Fundidesulfovibrio terrae]
MTARSLEAFPGLEAASLRAAALTAAAARDAVAARGRFSLALSGGATPARYFELLAAEDLPWDKVHVFWADERLVAPDSPDSNYRMARERLLSRAPIPEANVHPMRGAMWPGGVNGAGPSPDAPGASAPGAGQPVQEGRAIHADATDRSVQGEAAAGYEAVLRRFFGEGGIPAFDVVHLGLGGDGHTASLFPGQPALGERVRWVVPVFYAGASPPVPRLTLTLPVLNAACLVLFLASGADKAALARSAFSDDGGGYPAGLVRPAGKLVWLVGEA